jgi:hypothetical protein
MSTEEQRAYWRAKAKRQYWTQGKRDKMKQQYRATPRPARTLRTCLDCGEQIDVGRNGHRIRCAQCMRQREGERRRRSKARLHPEIGNKWRTCPCGTSFRLAKHHSHQVFCSPAHRAFYSTTKSTMTNMRPRALRYAVCLFCHDLLTLHSTGTRCQKPDCQRRMNATKMLWYMRRTRYSAVSYWRIANTPEAQRLAEDYFNLRMELNKHVRKHQDEWHAYYDAKRARDPGDPVGAGSGSEGG